MFHQIHCLVNGLNGRITLGGRGHIGNRLRQHNPRFRHSQPLHRLRRRYCHRKCVGICISNILSRKNHDSSCNKFDILSCIEHPRQIIDRSIRVRAPHTLNEGRNGIIMIIPCLIVGNHPFLDALTGNLKGDMDDSIITPVRGKYPQLNSRQCRPGIPVCHIRKEL